MTAVALALIALIITRSPLVVVVMFVVSAACAAGALAWVRHREHPPVDVPAGALWAGPATVRAVDLLGCPLLDTVTVKHPAAARRRPAKGVPGDLVLEKDGLTWRAALAAELAGVTGEFTLPWTSVVRAQAAPIPSATPGSGAIALTFGDGSKLDIALSGNYSGFRAALTRLPVPLKGLAD